MCVGLTRGGFNPKLRLTRPKRNPGISPPLLYYNYFSPLLYYDSLFLIQSATSRPPRLLGPWRPT